MSFGQGPPSDQTLRAFDSGLLRPAEIDAVARWLEEHPEAEDEVHRVLDGARDPAVEALRQPCALRPELSQLSELTSRVADRLLSAADGGAVPSAAMPQRVREYQVLRPLGRGGMGRVYLARHTRLQRDVALKLLLDHVAADAGYRARFEREMAVVGQLDHPHLIRAHDAGAEGPHLFLAMELLDGLDLAHLVADRGPVPLADACEVVRQAALGLHHAHEHGLVHRDVKPANLFLTRAGVVKVIDLGLARVTAGPAAGGVVSSAHIVMGTPDCMAPEQWENAAVDRRADLYSLGCTLFVLLTGQPPLQPGQPDSWVSWMDAHRWQAPVDLRDRLPKAPAALSGLVASLLAKQPERRPATAQAVADQLAVFASGHDLSALFTGRGGRPTDVRPAARSTQRHIRWHRGVAAVLLAVSLCVLIAILPYVRHSPVREIDRDSDPVAPPQEPPARSRHARLPRTLAELARFPDPLDDWQPGMVRIGALARDGEKDVPRELIARLGDGPFRMPVVGGSHWPVHSPDGRLVAVPNADVVAIYDAETGAFRRALRGHKIRPLRGSFSADGKRYACSADDGALRVWDVENGRLEAGVESSATGFWTTRFAAGDRQIVAAGGAGVVKVWDGAAGSELKSFVEHKGGITHFTFNPSQTRLVSAGKDGAVKIWDWPGGALVQTLEGHLEPVMAVAYSPDGSVLASGSQRRVLLWDAGTFQLLRTLDTPGDGLLAFTPDGRMVVTAPHVLAPGQERAFRRWDVKTGVGSDTLQTAGLRSWLVGDLSRDGRTVYLMSCDPGEPRLSAYDALTGRDRYPNQNQATVVWGVAFSPDGRWLASAGNDGSVCVWDLTQRPTGEFVFPARRLTGHTDEVWTVAFSPDGQLLASAGKDGTIRLWNIAQGRQLLRLVGSSVPVAALAFHPDGQALAAGDADGGVMLWNVAANQSQPFGKRHSGFVRAAAFSLDGRWLATGADDRTVHVVDYATGRTVDTFLGESATLGLAFSPDGTTLAASNAGPGPSLVVWVLGSKKERSFRGHDRKVQGIAFHPAGDRVATASADGTVRLWDTQGAAAESRVFDFRQIGSTTSTAFTPSGRHLAVGLSDGTVAILRAPARR